VSVQEVSKFRVAEESADRRRGKAVRTATRFAVTSDHRCPSHDLARLRRNGLITRRPHASIYDLTPDGFKFALFVRKERILVYGACGQPGQVRSGPVSVLAPAGALTRRPLPSTPACEAGP
jgi:hypothetical protein